jgi:hypothetical protein
MSNDVYEPNRGGACRNCGHDQPEHYRDGDGIYRCAIKRPPQKPPQDVRRGMVVPKTPVLGGGCVQHPTGGKASDG